MPIIRALPVDADKIDVAITMTAKLSEWKYLRAVIEELQKESDPRIVAMNGGTREPFWTLIYRLGDVISKVEGQHSDYGV